ncbi:MAG: glycosyltransferase family 2 protein [Lacisediminihabitans sp.]
MPFNTRDLAIIVVNYGSSELLMENLAPLAFSLPQAMVVVVDNFTDDAERERIVALCGAKGWLCETSPLNLGFGSGMNRGVATASAAGATYYLLLNPDAALTADSAVNLLEAVRSDPRSAVAPSVFRPDGSLWFGGADLYLADGRIRSRERRVHSTRTEPWLSGACIMISSELWGAVGGFSEEYFLYWEDVDLSHRILQAGGRLEVSATAIAVHAEGGTQGVNARLSGTPKSALYYYYNIRNRLLFASRNLSPEELRAWKRATLPIAWEVLLEGGRRQLLRSPKPLIAAARGVRDGLRIAHRGQRARSERKQS